MFIEKYGFTSPLERADIEFHDVRDDPFDLYGFCNPKVKTDLFRRLPEEVARATSQRVLHLSTHTAGGRIRFRTDSDCISLHVRLGEIDEMMHMPYPAIAGFDLYIRQGSRYRFYGSFPPSPDHEYERCITFPNRILRDCMIHFPLYCEVRELYIGLAADAVLEHGSPYRFTKPVYYYGSSITQGLCASLPGHAYVSMISIEHDCDFINLGFSAAALGEQTVARYIAEREMSAFVLDYDHNSSNPDTLRETHEPFYRTVRNAHPDLPIIFITRPNTGGYIHSYEKSLDCARRRAVVHDTYLRALTAGDRNVYYIDGDSLYAGPLSDHCSADGCHPSDAGFIRMAERIGAYVSAVLR